MDEQNNEIIENLVDFSERIHEINLKLENGQQVETLEVVFLGNEFHVVLSEVDPSNIPDGIRGFQIQRHLEKIIEQLEVFLYLVGADPDDKIGLSEERIAQFRGFKAVEDQVGAVECQACVEFVEEVGEELLMLDCAHIVHKKCAKDWFAGLNFCPDCSRVFT